MNIKPKTIFTGDNLPILRGINSNCIDLIYLDPPFNSKANYAAPIGSPAEGAGFSDIWTLNDLDIAWLDLIEAKHPRLNRVIDAALTKSDKSYLIYMAARLLEMHRILKDTGSIYLHCDPTMSHYLKIVMDCIFGKKNFRSEIIWQRHNAHNDKVFGKIHDIILHYSQVIIPIRDQIRLPIQKEAKSKRGGLTAPKPSKGEAGMPWRNILPPPNRQWCAPRTGEYAKYIEKHIIPNYTQINSVHKRLDLLDEAGLIHWSKNGIPNLIKISGSQKGKLPQSIWTDIKRPSKKERTGYPTQKPLALLDRIIKASTNKDDTILDPFCGCATTCVAADRIQRNWIGIDKSPKAAELVVKRIEADTIGESIDTQQQALENIIHREDIPKRTDISNIPRYNHPNNKKYLYGEQKGNCNGCDAHFEARHLEIDHIIAQGVGGTDHIENLQLLCNNCNRIKGDRGQEYLITKLKETP